MDRSEEFFDKIKNILKEGREEEVLVTPVEYKGIMIDLPKKQKEYYHGTFYEIVCSRSLWCKIKGDLVTDIDSEYLHKTLEESNCKVFSTHRHVKTKNDIKKEESHIHFICRDKDREDTIRMVQFLKKY